MYLIVGLGNIGSEYDHTKHNIGFRVVDAFAKKLGSTSFSLEKKVDALIAKSTFGSEKILLAKPTTFMNNSGIAVSKIMKYYKISEDHIIIVHDDADLVFGDIKISVNRGSAGHNGIVSIIQHLLSKNFVRIRVGISPKMDGPTKRPKSETFVLKPLTQKEEILATKITDKSIVAIENILTHGHVKASSLNALQK